MLKRPTHPRWLLVLVAAVGIVGVIGVNFWLNQDAPVQDVVAANYDLPPAFGSSRMLFGSVLAVLMGATVLGLGAIVENVRFLLNVEGSWRDMAPAAVITETVLLSGFIFLALGDVLVMAGWGETAAPANSTLTIVNRLMDFAGSTLLGVYLWRRLRARPVILFQLLNSKIPVELEPSWQQLRPKVMVAIGVMVVAFGVAFAK